jgi:hypothetical protein
MKLPRPRFTVRRLMLAVAIVALLAGAERLWRRSRAFSYLADEHGLRYDYWREEGLDHATGAAKHRDLAIIGDEESRQQHRRLAVQEGEIAADLAKTAAYHERLWRKYEHAARYPWLPVEPDPPEPE